MTEPSSSELRSANLFQRLSARIISSSWGARLTRFPPIANLLRTITRQTIRRQLAAPLPSALPLEPTLSGDALTTLQEVSQDLVENFGFVSAMMVTYAADGALPLRAVYVDPTVADAGQVQRWEAQITSLSTDRTLSLTSPLLPRMALGQVEYAANLTARAFHERKLVVSDDLFDLFRPAFAEHTRPLFAEIQQTLGVQQVIVVPVFLEFGNGQLAEKEFIGNLVALKREAMTLQDHRILQLFARQVALAILSEQRGTQAQAILKLIFDLQTTMTNETQVFRRIVRGVVRNLNYVGAMVAPFDSDGSLAMRAWYVDPAVTSEAQILSWEDQVAKLSPDRPISLTNPSIARIYVHRAEDAENLGSRACHSEGPVQSSELFDLFRPIATETTRPIIEGIQQALGVQRVIAVPFFLTNDANERELIGSLFVLSRSDQISANEIEILKGFGQQAAVALRNARLYRRAEDRRQAAEIFGKMAFSASASIHDLRNRVGAVRGFLQVLKHFHQVPKAQRTAMLDELTEPVFRNLDEIVNTLETLHEPFQHIPNTLVQVNACVHKALQKIATEQQERVELHLAESISEIYAAQDMIVEVFRVMLKNAAEAVHDKGAAGRVIVTSCIVDRRVIRVEIADNGTGIKPENLGRIFELRWTTKSSGMGFGLYWAKDYIEGLGGKLLVASQVGQGTTFTIEIPANGDQT